MCFLYFLNLEEANINGTRFVAAGSSSIDDGLDETEWPTWVGHVAIINCRRVLLATVWHWAWTTTTEWQVLTIVSATVAMIRLPRELTIDRRLPCNEDPQKVSLRWLRISCLCPTASEKKSINCFALPNDFITIYPHQACNSAQ